MVAGERQHEAGRQGVFAVKRWLESTTRFNVPWDVYGAWQQTSVPLLGGSARSYDLAGQLVAEDGTVGAPFYAEVKNYRSASGQYPLYQEFVAVSYSAMCQAMTPGLDPETEFMWVTWHPFSQGKFLQLHEVEEIEAACEKFPLLLGGNAFRHDVAETLSKRLWVLVVNRRQADMEMSRRFLGEVRRLITMHT